LSAPESDPADAGAGRRRAAAGGLDVVGLGQACVDHVCRVERLPPAGEKGRAREYRRLPGGQVATALLACARLGLRTAFAGGVGDDDDGERALAPLARAGVDLAGVRRRPGVPTQTGHVWIETASGERAIVWHRDPRLALRAEEVPFERIRAARALYLDAGDLEAALAAARAAREAGVLSVLDADTPAPGLADLLAGVDFPVVSPRLAETVHGTSDLREALARMVDAGARMAVIPLGPQGAIARSRAGEVELPAFSVRARDTTGAGDAFRAGLLWALLEGREPAEALRVAAAVAALNCREPGAQGGLPDRAGLEAFLERPPPVREPGPGARRDR